MKAKKVICCLVALFFMGLPVAKGDQIYLHRFYEGPFGIKVIDRNGLIRYDTETQSYAEMRCKGDLYFNCIEQTCTWPEDGCPCVK